MNLRRNQSIAHNVYVVCADAHFIIMLSTQDIIVSLICVIKKNMKNYEHKSS